MTTAAAMKNNTIENVQLKTTARLALETLYKKGRVGDAIELTVLDFDVKEINSKYDLIRRATALAYIVGKCGWVSMRTYDAGLSLKVIKKSNLRARDRVKAQKAKKNVSLDMETEAA